MLRSRDYFRASRTFPIFVTGSHLENHIDGGSDHRSGGRGLPEASHSCHCCQAPLEAPSTSKHWQL